VTFEAAVKQPTTRATSLALRNWVSLVSRWSRSILPSGVDWIVIVSSNCSRLEKIILMWDQCYDYFSLEIKKIFLGPLPSLKIT
jgi:hypothetical protein